MITNLCWQLWISVSNVTSARLIILGRFIIKFLHKKVPEPEEKDINRIMHIVQNNIIDKKLKIERNLKNRLKFSKKLKKVCLYTLFLILVI